MRDRRWSYSSLAPHAIFPLPVDDIADVVLGFIDIYTSLNAGLLERFLSAGEIETRVARVGRRQPCSSKRAGEGSP